MSRWLNDEQLTEYLRKCQAQGRMTTVAKMETERTLVAKENGRKRGRPKGKGNAPLFDPESTVLRTILAYLKHDPRVRWAARLNSGAMKEAGRFLRFGFPGCPDIVGQLRDGRALWIEAKSAQGRLSKAQAAFLALVASPHTVAGVARSLDDIRAILEA